jgi:holo-ACP synthase
MPGAVKDTQLTHKIFRIIEADLRKRLKEAIRIERLIISAEGPVMVRLLDMSAVALKRVAIVVEDETYLGRFVDLDVYDLNGKSISRTVLGLEPRRCYLCEASAHDCVRSQRHAIDALLDFMETEVMKAESAMAKTSG